METIKFLQSFQPYKIAKGLNIKGNPSYLIMIFQKNNRNIVIAESGKYGNATYYYITETEDDKEWMDIFKLDKQQVRKIAKRIYHDYEVNLVTWRKRIKKILNDKTKT